MSDSKKIVQIVLVFGGLWGACEATLGYLLHFLPIGFSGMIMFSIGFYFMFNAFKITGKQSAIFYTALIAAGIKSMDMLLPGMAVVRVVNPAVSIVLESLVVFAFARFYQEERIFSKSFTMGLGWVLLFIGAQALVLKPAEGLYLMPVSQMLAFIAMNTVVSGFLVGAYLKKSVVLDWRLNFQKLSFVQPVMIIVLAVLCEIGNSLI